MTGEKKKILKELINGLQEDLSREVSGDYRVHGLWQCAQRGADG